MAQTSKFCTSIQNQLVVQSSLAFFAKNCVLYPIIDMQIFNQMIIDQNLVPHEISENDYAKLTIGSPYTTANYMKDFAKNITQLQSDICKEYNEKIVSFDNFNFYYIENCKKRKFINFAEVESFRGKQNNNAILAISEYYLSLFERGRNMWVLGINYTFDKTDQQILDTLPPVQTICNQVKKKAPTPFVTYYHSSFYFNDCTLHPILNLTIELMQIAQNGGGIYELTTQEYLALPQGTLWNKQK